MIINKKKKTLGSSSTTSYRILLKILKKRILEYTKVEDPVQSIYKLSGPGCDSTVLLYS